MRIPSPRYIALVIALVASALTSAQAAAQASASPTMPPAGTWGAEAGVGGNASATLLRLYAPQRAWLLGVGFNLQRETTSGLDPFLDPSDEPATEGYVQGRLGHRWYTGDARSALQPTIGLGAVGVYDSVRDFRLWQAGAYGEVGATYFFGPHLSLGALGELDLLRGHQTQGTGTGTEFVRKSWSVAGNAVRVNAAVYF